MPVKQDNFENELGIEDLNVASDLNLSLEHLPSTIEGVNAISLEFSPMTSVYGFAAKAVDGIQGTFTGLVNKLSVEFNGDVSEQRKELHKFDKRAHKLVKDVQYKDIETREAPVILGLKVNLASVNMMLAKQVKVIDETLMDDLKGLDHMLGKILSSEPYRKSFKPRTAEFEEAGKRATEIQEALSAVVDANGVSDRRPVNKLITNMSSIPVITSDLVKISDTFNSHYISNVSKYSENISDKTKILYNMMNGGKIEMTKESLRAISYGLENVAQYVTAATSIYYLMLQQMTTIANLEKIIKR